MKKDGIFGEFFPMNMSPYGYNETNAAEFFPLTEEEVKKHGWKWRTDLPYTTGKETLSPQNVPDNIDNTLDSITKEVLACTICGKNYRIIQEELKFYKTLSIPVPVRC